MDNYIYRVHCIIPSAQKDFVNNSLPLNEYGPNSVSIPLYNNGTITHYGTSFVATHPMITFLSELFGNINGMIYWTLDINSEVLLYTNDSENTLPFNEYLDFESAIGSKNLSRGS